ncbi:Hypothetical predicted protein [Cloeon dipterum]|uniref:Uncharacterized protein n=1 Tax=Cloeon dipterum TaxID=197152 RepID=A0A8S1CT74_9INSE|nr:Hypothetical predicted protein [Cloeon dipterum]
MKACTCQILQLLMVELIFLKLGSCAPTEILDEKTAQTDSNPVSDEQFIKVAQPTANSNVTTIVKSENQVAVPRQKVMLKIPQMVRFDPRRPLMIYFVKQLTTGHAVASTVRAVTKAGVVKRKTVKNGNSISKTTVSRKIIKAGKAGTKKKPQVTTKRIVRTTTKSRKATKSKQSQKNPKIKKVTASLVPGKKQSATKKITPITVKSKIKTSRQTISTSILSTTKEALIEENGGNTENTRTTVEIDLTPSGAEIEDEDSSLDENTNSTGGEIEESTDETAIEDIDEIDATTTEIFNDGAKTANSSTPAPENKTSEETDAESETGDSDIELEDESSTLKATSTVLGANTTGAISTNSTSTLTTRIQSAAYTSSSTTKTTPTSPTTSSTTTTTTTTTTAAPSTTTTVATTVFRFQPPTFAIPPPQIFTPLAINTPAPWKPPIMPIIPAKTAPPPPVFSPVFIPPTQPVFVPPFRPPNPGPPPPPVQTPPRFPAFPFGPAITTRLTTTVATTTFDYVDIDSLIDEANYATTQEPSEDAKNFGGIDIGNIVGGFLGGWAAASTEGPNDYLSVD